MVSIIYSGQYYYAHRNFTLVEWVVVQILIQSPIWFVIWAEYSVILLFFSKKDLICKFLQSGSLYDALNVLFNTCSIFHRNFTLLDFWVSCVSNSDAKPDFDLTWAEYSVILLFFSETMKKIHYLHVFAIRLCTVCIKCFVYIQYY
jgi:hypothetical protein